MADPRGFSIARWTPPDQGSVILDSDTYINDIGILTASSLISEGALTIIAQSGAQLALLPNIDQETNITLVLPDTAGTQGNYLRIDTITQIGNVTKIGLDWAPGDGSGTVTSVGLTTSTSGLTISNTPITSAGNIGIALNTELQGLSTIASNGIIARTTAGTYTPRTITAGSDNITITNGNGISGNPIIKITSSPTFSNLGATKDIYAGGDITGDVLIGKTIMGSPIIRTVDNTDATNVYVDLTVSSNGATATYIFPLAMGKNGDVLTLQDASTGQLKWTTPA